MTTSQELKKETPHELKKLPVLCVLCSAVLVLGSSLFSILPFLRIEICWFMSAGI
jgi:hypothetical protein